MAEDLTGPPRKVPSVEVFGHSRLTEAVNVFDEQEKRGLTWLASEAETTRRGLAETINAYQKMDEDGAERFRGIAS